MSAGISRDDFDVAQFPGMRADLAAIYREMRGAETAVFQSMLDETGQFLPGVSYQRDCPACHAAGADSDLLYFTRGLHIVCCHGCGFVYSREVITPAADRQRYEASQAADVHLALKRHPVYARLEQTKSRYAMQRITRSIGTPGRMLDIGASTGCLMLAAVEQGWSARGIELNHAAILAKVDPDLDIVEGFFPQDLPPAWRDFTLMTLFDVLEHIEHPGRFLDLLHGQLAAGGYLAIQVPNFNSLLIRLEGADNSNLCHGHWSYFTAGTLQALMGAHGFEPVFAETLISELDKINAFGAGQIASTFRQLTGTEPPAPLSADALHRQLLGYKLFALFRKV